MVHTVSRSFAIPSFKSSVNSLVKKDRMEVCPLSREIMLQSLSVPITGAAFAFSIAPYPHFPWASLTVCFPAMLEKIRAYHVSHNEQCGLGSASTPTVIMSMCPHYGRGQPTATPFGSGLSATLACSHYNDVYWRFTLH